MATRAPIDEGAARRRKENAAAERRKARRSAIRPVISGDPEIGSTARRATGCGVPHQRLSAFCSPHFFKGSGKQTRGTRPHQTGPAQRWLKPLQKAYG